MKRQTMVREKFLLLLVCIFAATQALALTPDEAKSMVTGENDARIEALNKALSAANDKTSAFLQAMADDTVKIAGQTVVVIKDGKAADPVTGAEVAMPAALEDVGYNNRMRGEIDTALATLKLFSKDEKQRAQAVQALLKDPDEGKLALLDKALALEANATLKAQLQLARAAALLGSADKAQRMAAAKALASSKDPATQLLLNDRLKLETEADVKAQLESSLTQIRSTLGLGDKLGIMFTGLSLGSVLLLAALGLLLLAFIGTKFVLEIVLQRST